MLRTMVAGFTEDTRSLSLRAACARAARVTWFALTERSVVETLLTDPSCRSHVAAVAPRDELFFAAHRSYLVRGLDRPGRGQAALVHYRNESSALDAEYHQAVYGRGELRLWRREHEGVVFDIRLMPGNDVLFEGGLSLTFFVDDHRIAVLSYSNVVPWLLDGRPPPARPDGSNAPLVPFVTRRQSSFHAYRRAFTDTFGRGTPGHLCVAALEGIALAQGSRELRGIPADRHPAGRVVRADGESHLETMYDEFWRSLSGARSSPLAWAIPLPLQSTPLEELNSKNRRRAIKLRRHLASVRDAAFRAYRPHLLRPAAIGFTPGPECRCEDASGSENAKDDPAHAELTTA